MMILESGRRMAAESSVKTLSLFDLGSTYRRDSLGRKLSPRKSLSTVKIAKGMQGTSNKRHWSQRGSGARISETPFNLEKGV